jgi:hypothetical protein
VTDPLRDFTHDARARVNRVDKASRIADVLVDGRKLPDPLDDTAKRAVERLAGVRRASDETWSMAVEMFWERR